MTEGSRVVVLGAGIGGLTAARKLRKALPSQHGIVVVERNTEYVFQPSLLWLMAGSRRPGQVQRPVRKLIPRGVEFMTGTVDRIDPAAKVVTVAGAPVPFDYLVIALGADLAPERIPGLPESGHNFYTLDGAASFAAALRDFKGGRIVVLTATPAYKCPAAPYEAAMLIDAACRSMGIRERTQIEVHAAEPAPMPVAGAEVGEGVRRLLEERGISYTPAHQVERADSGRELVFADGARIKANLLAYVPPHQAPAAVQEAGLCAPSGWVAADPATLATEHPGVFAIGDIVSIPLQMGRPLPKAGVFAAAQAEVVAANITAAVNGQPAIARFDGHGSCLIETGGGRAAYGGGDFYAVPLPVVAIRPPDRRWHMAKVLLEWRWLRRWPLSMLRRCFAFRKPPPTPWRHGWAGPPRR